MPQSPIPIYSTITQSLFPFKQSHSCSCVLSTHLFRSRARPFVQHPCLSRLTTSTSNQAENGHKYFFLLDFTFAFHGWTSYFPLSLSAYLGEILMQKTVTSIQGSHLCSQSTAYLRVQWVRKKKLENETEERNRQRVCADIKTWSYFLCHWLASAFTARPITSCQRL